MPEVLATLRALENDGVVSDVVATWANASLLDIVFRVGDEAMLVEVAAGDQAVRIVGRRREYERPVGELAALLQDWPNLRRG